MNYPIYRNIIDIRKIAEIRKCYNVILQNCLITTTI